MKKFTPLYISDIHMNNRLPHSKPGPSGVSDRLQDQLDLWKRVGRSAEEANVDAIFIVGDLFDKSLVDAVTLTETVAAIAALPGEKYILPGNHDAVNTRGGRFTVEAFGKMGNDSIHYMETGERLTIPGHEWIGFWPAEYSSQEVALDTITSMRAKAAALTKRDKRTEVLMLHHSILGCRHVGWTCDDGLDADVICQGFDWVVSGHFHDTQTFGPLDKGFYLGAPLHLRFDDADRPAGYWIVNYTNDGGAVRNFVDGGCPRFHELEWPNVKPKKGWAVGDYVRINVTATAADWTALKDEVTAVITKLNVEHGFKATHKHKPLYHHTHRITSRSTSGSATLTPEDMMEGYLDAPEVDKGDLDRALLARIGREALEAAKAKVA